jgi:glycine betaine monooxygenase A
LKGKLIAASHMDPDFSSEEYGLKEVHAQTWHGFVFINLSPDPVAPVAETLAQYAPAFEDYELAQAKIARSIVYPVRANWKFLHENYMECYHCAGAHPEYCKVYDLKHYFAENREQAGRKQYGETDDGEYFTRPGVKSITMNGQYVVRKLLTKNDSIDSDRLLLEGAAVKYSWLVMLHPDYAISYAWVPLDVSHSEVRCDWLVAGDAREGIDYDSDELVKLWDVTNLQDWRIVEVNQLGVQSRSYEPGPHSLYGEPKVSEFIDAYLSDMAGFIGADGRTVDRGRSVT